MLAFLFSAFSISLLICCPLSHAVEKAEKKAPADMNDQLVKSDSPIHITADRMESNQEQKIITFEGHVFVQQDDLNITSNHLKVVLLPGDKVEKAPAAGDRWRKLCVGDKLENVSASGVKVDKAPATGDRVEKAPATGETSPSQRIDYIEFTGDVKVTSKDRLATANKAIFYQKEQKITLHGRPVVAQGQDQSREI